MIVSNMSQANNSFILSALCICTLNVWTTLQFIINNFSIVSVVMWSCAQARHAVCIYHTAMLMSCWIVPLQINTLYNNNLLSYVWKLNIDHIS